MLVSLLQVQLVYLRLVLAEGGRFALRAYHIEHDDLVPALLQPASRHIKRLLWAYAPESSYGVAVDIHLAFLESLCV